MDGLTLVPDEQQYKNEQSFLKTSFPNLNEAIRKGLTVRGFRSGGGLRVVRVETKQKLLTGYGEHPEVLTALSYADEDVKSGASANYQDFYGKVVPNYVTGQSNAVSKLDKCLLQGHKFKAYFYRDEVVLEIHGYDIDNFDKGEHLLFKVEGFDFDEVLERFEQEYNK